MPTPAQLESLADEYKVHLKTVKRYEKDAEKALEGQYDADSPAFHGTAYKIIENMLKKHKKKSFNLPNVSKFILNLKGDHA